MGQKPAKGISGHNLNNNPRMMGVVATGPRTEAPMTKEDAGLKSQELNLEKVC